jgi:queuine tRNA-ribosyltransferase
MFEFDIVAKDGKARAGRFHTPHGTVETPAFMPVGTNAAVKALSPEEIRETGTSIILANAYHLYLRPGADVIEHLGGLHRFMAWDGPILTDSGGFQVYSLAPLRKIDADGVTFRSHIDGTTHRFTPESAIRLQERLGADIIMCLDECTPHDHPYEEAKRAAALTTQWAERCLNAKERPDQALVGIVQGGMFADLRAESAGVLSALDLPGYAIGGLCLGEEKEKTLAMIDASVTHLPDDRPRYLMGAGTPEDFLLATQRGIDLFDCVVPTRLARNGHCLTWSGRISLKQAQYRLDSRPIDENCRCVCCQRYTRAYLRHLFMAGEILVSRLATIHNVTFFQEFLSAIRSAITSSQLAGFSGRFLPGAGRGAIPVPENQES